MCVCVCGWAGRLKMPLLCDCIFLRGSLGFEKRPVLPSDLIQPKLAWGTPSSWCGRARRGSGDTETLGLRGPVEQFNGRAEMAAGNMLFGREHPWPPPSTSTSLQNLSLRFSNAGCLELFGLRNMCPLTTSLSTQHVFWRGVR